MMPLIVNRIACKMDSNDLNYGETFHIAHNDVFSTPRQHHRQIPIDPRLVFGMLSFLIIGSLIKGMIYLLTIRDLSSIV
jgi:hypothetical protein